MIFVSAYGDGETLARALEAGAADYIVKPFSPAELAARVALALRRQSPPAPWRSWRDRTTCISGSAGIRLQVSLHPTVRLRPS